MQRRPRLTPARAGTTWPGMGGSTRARAHPRSRGDDYGDDRSSSLLLGSPPLARGRRSNLNCLRRGGRLTPARAGTTAAFARHTTMCEAHPRSRGDDLWRESNELRVEGSPPLARGRQGLTLAAARARRLTPARAGTTQHGAAPDPDGEAHPRSRGDDCVMTFCGAYSVGSPPLARGRHDEIEAAPLVDRLTPARAGTTG